MVISEAIQEFLDLIEKSRAVHTRRTYANGLNKLAAVLADHGLDAGETPITEFPEEAVLWLAELLKDFSPATERLYLAAALKFCTFLEAQEYTALNLARLRLKLDLHTRRHETRLPHFSADNVRAVIEYASRLPSPLPNDEQRDSDSHLRRQLLNLRDWALIVTLADTGLRIHEACGLTRGQIDWYEGKALIRGKGGKEAIIRFSNRSLEAMKNYLTRRDKTYPKTGHRIKGTQPVFSGHGKHQGKAGAKLKPLSTKAARVMIRKRVIEALGPEAEGTITPHTFRHYFVTTVMRASGGDLKIAKEMARHANLSTTEQYAHLADEELDQNYHKIFNQE